MIDAIGNPINYDIQENIIQESKVPLAKIVRSDYQREQPIQVTFEQLIKYHDRTPQLQIAVSSYSELITGTEMRTYHRNGNECHLQVRQGNGGVKRMDKKRRFL